MHILMSVTLLNIASLASAHGNLGITSRYVGAVKRDASSSSEITSNDIPVIATTVIRARDHYNDEGKGFRAGLIPPSIHGDENNVDQYVETTTSKLTLDPRDLKRKRLLRFLSNFRLDFTKFDTTCLKREGRGLVAPSVPHARIIKYTRRRNKVPPRNPYAMALYECNDGFEFPQESSDRMFCSKNKWVGPTPVCLPKGSLDESECNKCDQICTAEEEMNGKVRAACSCYVGYQLLANGTCGDIDECSINNGGCSQICYNKPGSFQCHCPTGFRPGPDGKTCIDRNECLLRNGHGPCQDACENTPGSYLCNCKNINGTRLSDDKHSCEDINECEERDNFGCSHICLNTFGNAFCTCPKGLSLSTDDYKTCLGDPTNATPENLEYTTSTPPLVIDCPPGSAPAFNHDDSSASPICVEHEDCTVDNGGCEHECIPSGSGSFRFCACRDGYDLLNETACVDINECESENGGCEQICVNTLGSFYCACKNGYKLVEDQKSCQVTFCEPPPIRENTVGWECEYPSLVAFVNGDKPRVGTRCKLRCLPGFSLMSPHDSFLNSIFVGSSVEDDNSILSAVAHKWITCAEDGEWKGLEAATKSICVLTSCPSLTAPEHGTIFPKETCLDDNVPLNSQCLLLCNPGYYAKNGRIRTCSRGFQWFPEDKPICIKLPPTPRPYIHCPSDILVDLPPGQGTAYLKIPQPQANMDWHRYVEAFPSWAKNLEWDALPGVTQISFVARSPISNDTATCSFKVHVVDREAPRVHGCPTSFEIRISPAEGSREVWWSEPKFSDNVNLKYVQQSHSPGHTLSRGNHHISYVAGDAEGNKARCSFTVTVHDDKSSEMADYGFSHAVGRGPNFSHFRNIMVICPNLKTGRWMIHYTFRLPSGCRYSPPNTRYEAYSKYSKNHHTNPKDISRLRRKTLHDYKYNYFK